MTPADAIAILDAHGLVREQSLVMESVTALASGFAGFLVARLGCDFDMVERAISLVRSGSVSMAASVLDVADEARQALSFWLLAFHRGFETLREIDVADAVMAAYIHMALVAIRPQMAAIIHMGEQAGGRAITNAREARDAEDMIS